jgi:ATP-dependent DNA helicase RecG
MKLPNWADEQLSNDLPILRSQGESQHLEFKKKFPSNAQDLAKEIAAFATSNQGTILIGVSDEGDLVGVSGAENQDVRDSLLKRLGGICSGTIKPAITPTAKFAYENDLIVLVINVPKGKQPIYYKGNIPYVRHFTDSRPAEPHEVLELIGEYLDKRDIGQEENGNELRSSFYSELANVVGDTLIYADQVHERNVNPWLDQWRSAFGYAAEELRELAAHEIAVEDKLEDELRDAANALDRVANLRLTLGCGPQLNSLTDEAKDKLQSIKERKLDSIPLSQDSLIYIQDSIISTGRKLRDLAGRAHDLIESGRIEELQENASEYGHDLLRIAKYDIDSLGDNVKENLISVGRSLHLIETITIYMDGGASLRAIQERVEKTADELEQIINNLKSDAEP